MPSGALFGASTASLFYTFAFALHFEFASFALCAGEWSIYFSVSLVALPISALSTAAIAFVI